MFASVPWIAGRQNSIYIVLISFHFLFYDCIYSWLGKEMGTSWWNLYGVGRRDFGLGPETKGCGDAARAAVLGNTALAPWILVFTRGING